MALEEKLIAEIREIHETLDHIYSESGPEPNSPKRLPEALYPYAGPLGIIDRVTERAVREIEEAR